MARKTYLGAVAVTAIVSFIIVNTAARNRTWDPNLLKRRPVTPDTVITGQTKIDSTGKKKDSLRYPLKDRRGPKLTEGAGSAIDLHDPSNINKTVEYDPVTKQYTVTEKIGNQYYRNPTYLSFDEFYKLQSQQSEQDYWQKRASTLGNLNQRGIGPTLYTGTTCLTGSSEAARSTSAHREASILPSATRDKILRTPYS